MRPTHLSPSQCLLWWCGSQILSLVMLLPYFVCSGDATEDHDLQTQKHKTVQSIMRKCKRGMKMTVFWDVALCSLVEINWCFKGAYCPHDGGSKNLWNVSQFLPNYTLQHLRRKSSSYSLLWEPETSLNSGMSKIIWAPELRLLFQCKCMEPLMQYT
jgi:hypothetical protein